MMRLLFLLSIVCCGALSLCGASLSAADFNKEDALKRKDAILKRFVEEFVTLTPGKGAFHASFVMGSEKHGADNERPVHKVTLSAPFAMAKYEVPSPSTSKKPR